MKIFTRYRLVFVNLLVSLAISLVVNFSYFILFLGTNPAATTGRRGPTYLSALENPELFLFLQIIYYILLSFCLLSVVTAKPDNALTSMSYVRKTMYCILIAGLFYFFTPSANRQGDIILLLSSRRVFSPMPMLKGSFVLIVSLLYGKIYELVFQKQDMKLENELLRNENLENKFNVLASQINPHFLFNSLNSLSMLVREKHTDKALAYIDQLSDTFRYIIRNGQQSLTPLREELEFLDAFKYLHEVRYAGKLFFDIDIDPEMENRLLPPLSLQPLVENAVKHNRITRSHPFRVSIRTEDGYLVVSNPVIPKIEGPDSTGIGLKNLSSRYLLLTGQDIVVERADDRFVVKLPLIRRES